MERTKEGELAWTDLSAKDIEAQTRFYAGLFGWTHGDVPTTEGLPPYRMFSKDGQVVAGAGPITPADVARTPASLEAAGPFIGGRSPAAIAWRRVVGSSLGGGSR